MLAVINLILILLLIASMIYLYFKQNGHIKTSEKRFDELKSRMGTLVKELNYILVQKRKMDDEQTAHISDIRMSVAEEFSMY